MSRLEQLFTRIDELNAQDPEQADDGATSVPAALLYGRRMSQILETFDPEASEELAIAARGQHIERWLRPRTDYPEGREGYLAWRRDAARYHAERVTGLMASCGYDEAARERVSGLMRKKHLKADPEVQTLEDVACLVFLRWYAGAFSHKHAMEKVLPSISKTAAKMSARGRAAALDLNLPPPVTAAIAEAG
jgi:hypothetical protein